MSLTIAPLNSGWRSIVIFVFRLLKFFKTGLNRGDRLVCGPLMFPVDLSPGDMSGSKVTSKEPFWHPSQEPSSICLCLSRTSSACVCVAAGLVDTCEGHDLEASTWASEVMQLPQCQEPLVRTKHRRGLTAAALPRHPYLPQV